MCGVYTTREVAKTLPNLVNLIWSMLIKNISMNKLLYIDNHCTGFLATNMVWGIIAPCQ